MRAFLSLAVALAATASATSYLPPSKPLKAPNGYVHTRRSHPHDTLELVFAIKQRNTHELESLLYRVSDPESAFYGKHVSKETLDRMLGPSRLSQRSVLGWLKENGVEDVELLPRGYARTRVTVAQAEALLNTEYHVFSHATTPGLALHRCLDYSLPAELEAHLDFVAPTTQFPTPRTLRRSKAPAPAATAKQQRKGGLKGGLKAAPVAAPLETVTPDVIRRMYGIGADNATFPGSKQAAAGFLQQYASLSDLTSFFAQFDPNGAATPISIIGPNDQANPGMEADLDVQYIMGIGAGVNTTYWYTAGQQPYDNEPFLVWLLNITALPDAEIPKTISVSYGDNEDTVEIGYATRVNAEFQALGARGVSIMFSSGDGGVAGSQPSDCPNGFIPTFPAASPYVTAVGATDVPSAETAAQFSTGGFSNYWGRPPYQVPGVSRYLKLANASGTLPAAHYFNQSGIGFPDVAAIGTNFNIVCFGATTTVDGTSCSSPTFAGMVALLNDHRLAAGKATLGWLNPLIWKTPGIFRDITTGNNPGCGTNGFTATQGWDPITGWGSLDYQAALKLVMSLP